ncbi:hypothetical protein MTO96_036155, partial [Rhipicephalus appendiculatus]
GAPCGGAGKKRLRVRYSVALGIDPSQSSREPSTEAGATSPGEFAHFHDRC